jgi:ribosomal protein S18 acetylase RimI-like enzyme
MDVRTLHTQDAADFQHVFLRALREHPEAFGVSVSEQEAQSLTTLADWFGSPDSRYYGAYTGNTLVGIMAMQRYQRSKMKHRAGIGPMYVAPEVRGQGIGKRLLEQGLSDARLWQGLKDVVLAVTVGNEAARKLYMSAGFTPYSVDPRLLQIDGRYFDVEWMIQQVHR